MKPLEKIHSFFEGVTFSLTLTLSRWEREQPLTVFRTASGFQAEASCRFARRLGAFLPLPKVEGRGEGKVNLVFQWPKFICSVLP